MTYRDIAKKVMEKAYNDAIASGVTDPVEIGKIIDAAYPFGERRYWPYKVWLSERLWFFALKGIPTRAQKKLSDQQSLMEDT